MHGELIPLLLKALGRHFAVLSGRDVRPSRRFEVNAVRNDLRGWRGLENAGVETWLMAMSHKIHYFVAGCMDTANLTLENSPKEDRSNQDTVHIQYHFGFWTRRVFSRLILA